MPPPKPELTRRAVLAGIGGLPLAAAAGMPEPVSPAGREPAARRGRDGAPAGDRTATLLRGAELVLTMDPAVGEGPLGTLENGVDVLLRDGRIDAVGRRLGAPPGARVVDVRGKLVLPGFVDLHNHLWQAGIRGGCADRDLAGWLSGCNRPALPRIDAQDMYRLVLLAALDVVRTGVTTVVDWVHPIPYGTTERYVRALADAGPRFVYAAYQPASGLPLVRKAAAEFLDPLPLASAQVASRAAWPDRAELRQCRELARELGVMLNCHVLERRADRADQPVRALRWAGAFGPGLLMNHAVHLTAEEVALTGAHDVRVAYCPLSNMRLGSGIAPLPALHRHGVRAGLGQDGGTNDTSDMFALMKAAVGLQRARHEDASVHPTIPAVLRMATLGGAECLGMADRIGSLTPGKRADVVVLDPGTLNFAPRFDWTSQIVLNGQPPNVTDVFVDGRPLKSGGELPHVDVERVIHEAERAAARLRAAV
ncbi:amidohydrolase family protein [Streptomyces sp. NPDC001339]|uniref:amidohydrolase family protein n=1 Tax=Streptomyces sp. NPDC001339 TaxID=3364563 RepID=UPI0036C06107